MDDFVEVAHAHRACYPAGEKLILMSEDQSRELLEKNRDMRIRVDDLELQRRVWHVTTAVCAAVAAGFGFLIGILV